MAPKKRAARQSKAVNQRQVANEVSERAKMQAHFDNRMNLIQRMASSAGLQYGGRRDIYGTAGYIMPGSEQFSDYWGLYERGEVAGRIVDMPPKTTWRTPPEIKEEGKEETKFTKEFALMAKRLRVWEFFNRVDRLAGVGRYAVLFIGTKGTTDQSLKQPLQKAKADDIIYLSVYHEQNAEVAEWEDNVASPRYGLPRTYKLKTSSDVKFKKAGSELLVDASRCIHVAENKLEDDVYGRPRLKRALNRLFDLDKVAGSTGEAYWQMAVRILQAKIDPQAEITPAQMKDLDEKMSAMVHDLKRHFYGQGVELSWLPEGTPNVQQVADFYFSLIAAAAEIPKRILFGSEMGELASSTDQETYFGMINERQEQFAEPQILRAFIDKLIGVTALPAPQTKEYHVSWPALFEESDDARASKNLKIAQTASALTPVGANPIELVTIDADGNVKLIERKEGDKLPESHQVDDGADPDGAEDFGLEVPAAAGSTGVGGEPASQQP